MPVVLPDGLNASATVDKKHALSEIDALTSFTLLWGQLQSTNDEDCRKTYEQSVAGDAQRPFADLKNLASRG